MKKDFFIVPVQAKLLLVLVFVSLFFVSNLKADYLKSSSNFCVSDYWFVNGTLYYYKSDNNLTLITTTQNDTFIDGYEYNTENNICSLYPIPQKLGIQYHEYKFLMGLMGLLVGFGWLMGLLHIFSRR